MHGVTATGRRATRGAGCLHDRAPGPPTHAVLLFDGFDELDAVGPFEVLAAAGLPVRALGLPDADPVVRAANGMTFVVDGSSTTATS